MNCKSFSQLLAVGLISLSAGCVSTKPIAIAPVGPAPASQAGTDSRGQLEVYSALLGFTSGNAAWYLHTGYYLCNQQGKPLQYVENVANYSTGEPALVSLPPGDYIIHAEATGDVGVEVPVVIEAGQTTAVHLDNSWGPPQEYPKSSFVSLPSGEPVGWSAGTK